MIEHRTIATNGIQLHIAETGAGPLVVLCHGWPELWYSWRYQLPALAAAGFRVVAPDMRGYGASDAPDAIEQYTQLHIAGDIIGLIQALGERQAVVIGHDWGAPVAWNCAVMRPDMVRAVAGLSVIYQPRGEISLMHYLRARQMDKFYISFFQQPGAAEADFDPRARVAMRRILYSISGDIPPGEQWRAFTNDAGSLVDSLWEPTGPLAWLSDAELDYYATEFERTGFRGGFNWYRNIERSWELLGAFKNAPIAVPALFLAGTRDGTLRMPGVEEAMKRFTEIAPKARPHVLIEGAGHWVQQERADEVNAALIGFLRGL